MEYLNILYDSFMQADDKTLYYLGFAVIVFILVIFLRSILQTTMVIAALAIVFFGYNFIQNDMSLPDNFSKTVSKISDSTTSSSSNSGSSSQPESTTSNSEDNVSSSIEDIIKDSIPDIPNSENIPDEIEDSIINTITKYLESQISGFTKIIDDFTK